MPKKKIKISSFGDLERVLPKQSYSLLGLPMEPINIVVVGNRRYIYRHFKQHGWFAADKLGAISLIKALVASSFNLSYHEGIIGKSYVKGKPFLLGFQRPTRADTFRRRHHLRLWQTPYKINARRVWAGTLSYDRSVGVSKSLWPTHHISPTLSWEESFLAASIGIKRPRHLTLSRPSQGQLGNGDHYQYDGKALVIDLSGYEL
jgi:hypothetical protein